MKICIFGAGAIGSYLGALLAEAGADVSLVARGAHLDAIQANGLRLESGGKTRTIRLEASDDPAALSPADYVIVTLKAHSAAPVAADIARLIAPEGAAVWAVNGVPWWYFHGIGDAWQGRRVDAVDPGGALWTRIGPDRVIGCVVYPACEVTAPGIVRHIEGDRFSLGEPAGMSSGRTKRLAALMIEAGLKAPVRPRIRDELWVKLWGNLAFNPISALTGATLDVIATDPGTRALARHMMEEAQSIAEALGVRFPISIEKRIDGAGAVGAHKTSMLQDLERGRMMEIDALIGAVAEMGRMMEIKTPAIDAVLALVIQRARGAGCYI